MASPTCQVNSEFYFGSEIIAEQGIPTLLISSENIRLIR